MVDPIRRKRTTSDFVTNRAAQHHLLLVGAFKKAIGYEQERIRSAATVVAVQDLARVCDRCLAKNFVTLSFALQEPQLAVGEITSADEIVSTHGHLASVFVAKPP